MLLVQQKRQKDKFAPLIVLLFMVMLPRIPTFVFSNNYKLHSRGREDSTLIEGENCQLTLFFLWLECQLQFTMTKHIILESVFPSFADQKTAIPSYCLVIWARQCSLSFLDQLYL